MVIMEFYFSKFGINQSWYTPVTFQSLANSYDSERSLQLLLAEIIHFYRQQRTEMT